MNMMIPFQYNPNSIMTPCVFHVGEWVRSDDHNSPFTVQPLLHGLINLICLLKATPLLYLNIQFCSCSHYSLFLINFVSHKDHTKSSVLRMSSRLKIVSNRMAQHLTTHTIIVNYKKGTYKRNKMFKFSFFRVYQRKTGKDVPLYSMNM